MKRSKKEASLYKYSVWKIMEYKMYKEVLRNIKNDKNRHYIDRYIKFIETCINYNFDKIDVYEKHHILPRSIYPEYKNFKKNKWNKAVLTLRQHFIAHWMLAKIYNGSQWFSFNQMKRYGGTSILYEYGRIYQSEQCSKLNKGRKHTEEQKKAHSLRMKNTLIVKDSEGVLYRVSKNDPRYISGDLISNRVGYIHPESTIEKMKKNSWMKGKSPFIIDNKTVFLETEYGLSQGYKIGLSSKNVESIKDFLKNSIWVTLRKTGKYKRINAAEYNESIHEKGRVGFKGFAIINEKRRLEREKLLGND